MRAGVRPWIGAGLFAWANVACADASLSARCAQAAPAARVSVATRDAGWRIDNSLSWRTLTHMKPPGIRGATVLGLTHTESRVALQLEGELLSDPDTGAECIAPRVAVDLRYLPIVIYVGREFGPQTCAYREILAHEMRHLNAYLGYLPKVEERVRTRLAERFDGRPVYGRGGEAQALLRREIDTRWMPYIKAEMAQIETLQASIDTPQEYARLSKVCRGEVQSLIGSTRPPRS